ncbi:MAG: radical SAM protein [Pseudomonadota bacterium]
MAYGRRAGADTAAARAAPKDIMRLLLINPRFPESFWSFRWALARVLKGRRAVNPPLGLATLAALTPPHWQVTIVDENVEAVPLAPEADLIGVCGMGVQFPRQAELLRYYRSRGYATVAGGSYASLVPERYAGLADTVVAGEAEYIWPRFCADFERGAAAPAYREGGTVNLADSPPPRFDLLRLERYQTATLQISRGCPYLCDFCDIIVMFGRKPRYKALAQVERELDALRAAGARKLFFVDDNLIGHRAYARELMRFLIDYQARHRWRFHFGAQVSLNVAQDDELLRLLREAGFTWLFIGIESPDPAALKEMRKSQNTLADPLESVRRIYAHGMEVLGGFIVGFDADRPETFALQYDFIQAAGIQAAMVGLLTALPRTPLYARLESEGRLREGANEVDNTGPSTNVIPRGMSYDALVDGYQALYARLLDDAAIAGRIRNKLAHMAAPRYGSEYRPVEGLAIVARLVVRGILPGGVRRAAWFLRSLPWLAPRKVPVFVSDWITALALRDSALRRFPDDPGAAGLEAQAGSMRKALAAYLRAGRAELAVRGGALSLRLQGLLDARFYRRAARHTRRLLRRTSCTLVLHVPRLDAAEIEAFQRLLRRLSRHGDRVRIVASAAVHRLVPIDSSVFQLTLEAETDAG